MAEISTEPTNGKSTIINWEKWPSKYQAQKQLDLRMRPLEKLIKDGVLTAIRTPLGQIRIDPKSIEAYVNEKPDGIDEDEEVQDRDAARQGIPAEAIRATAELLKSANAQNIEQQKQNAELVKLVINSFKAAQDAQDKTISRLMERIDRTETVITGLYEARENYYDTQLERNMVVESHKAAGARRAQMWDLTTQYLGELVQGAKKKWGLDDESSAKLSAAADLLKTMTTEQIEVAAMMGFFNPDQIELIEKVIGRKIQKNTAPHAHASGENSQHSPEAASGAQPTTKTTSGSVGEADPTHSKDETP